MKMITLIIFTILSLVVMAQPASCTDSVRIGYFANITHAQALVGKANGSFARKAGVKIDWKVFNAGPTAMEALLAGALDMAYVGPNPALNAYVRSGGTALRIVAGAASGGAALVVQKDAGIKTPADLKGKRVASPEYGNTQDVALRHWLKSNGMKAGRDVQVMPVKNPEILELLRQKRIAAAWLPEPWVSRAVSEAAAVVFLDERSLWAGGRFPTAVLVVRKEYLEKHRDVVAGIIAAHVDTTGWIQANSGKAIKLINEELAKITRKALPERTLKEAFSRLSITYDPARTALLTAADNASELGFLPANAKVPLAGILDLSLLNQQLAGRGEPGIK